MYIRINNNKNDSFYLVGRPSDVADPGFITTNIDGLTDLAANLSTISNAGVDGDIVNSSKLMPRPITVTLTLHSTETASIDDVTNTLKKAFPLKSTARIVWGRDDGNILTITGIVDNISRPRFGDGAPARTMQISLYCSDPLFFGPVILKYARSATEESPLEIDNIGEYESGLNISLHNSQAKTPPTIFFSDGSENVESFGFNGALTQIPAHSTINISTEKGKKRATLKTGNNTVDITPYVTVNSSWYQASPGNHNIYLSSAAFELTVQVLTRFL